ncbi:MAG TPA: calcium-binding protein, partial [Vicinamibacterales bacterium]|nr:calcium-binding protein [Vicinamibacterales bacterium]
MSDQHLIGTEGDDFLQGAEGNDWLEGLGGNDVLLGGAGDDLYMPGAGVDYISDFDGFDELSFAPGISPDQVERIRLSGSYDLILRVAATGEQVTIGGWFYSATNQIERVVFDDGTVWNAADTSSLRRLGTAGDDFVQGTEYDERLEGRGGNDVLLGGAGNDVYVPGFGGSDWVSDFAGDDELRLDGVSPDQIERIRQSGSYDLVLRVAGTGDQITLGGWFYDAANQIERIVFDDDTVWDAAETSSLRRFGTAGDDFVQGTEYDERLEGRGGNDVLLGGAGNDVYVPGFGGSDWVSDFAGDDELRLEGVSPDQIERIRQSGSYDLVLRVAGTGDQVTLGGWFYDATNQIERLVFDDATTWNVAETGSLRRFGTAGDDFIQGTEYDERLEGRGGNDVLLGGAGNDTYGPGFGGSDWVSDFAGDDELRLDGVSPDQVERIRQSGSYDLVLRVTGTGEQVTIGGWFYDATNQIERVVFDGGTVWDAAQTGSLRRFGTAGDDFMQGTEYDERLEGRGGNDVLLGGTGNDTYVPGLGGADWITDFAGDDEVRLEGVSPDQIERMRPSGSYDLVLRVAGTGDQVTLGGWFYDAANQIERVVFDDGTVWDPATTSTLGAGSNHTPFVASPIADQSATENAGFSFAVPAGTFADPDAGDVLTLSARLASGEPLPAWLSFDPATGTFSGTPPFGTAGSVSIEVIATDSGGLTAGDQFDIGVAAGVNEIYGSEGNDFISGSPGNDLIWAGAGDDEVWGLEGHDAIYADVTATPGNDTVYGGSGSDFIYGGGGTDLLVGGSGDDSYEFISGTTQVVEYAGEGHDQVGVQDSYALPANVEDLRLYGAAVYGTGNELANLILGTEGDNLIDGRGGADNMQGFTGNDTYVVDNPGDLVFESGSAGTDTVESSITYALGANVENLVLTGAVTIDGTGNGRNNVLTGNAAANVLTGGLGDDTYVVDPSDTIVELFNEGSDTVLIASSYALGANLENLTLSGSAAIDGTGNGAVNVIRGNSAANTLRGEFGNDSLYGFGGDDVLDGGVGHDTMVGGA